MAQLTKLPDPLAAVGDFPEIAAPDGKLTGILVSALVQAVRNIIQILNRGISLGSGATGYQAGNLDAQYVDMITPGVADTEFEVPHQLGRVPIGYEPVRQDRAVSIYDSNSGSWNDSRLFLKANVASASIKLRVY